MPHASTTFRQLLAAGLACALLAGGCASRSSEVRSEPADPADFATWSCNRMHDEMDAVQQRAADVAYSVDERAGNNILALGVGVTVFWPALLAMRPDGLEAADLARLKGRYEALVAAASSRQCPPPDADLSAATAAGLPVRVGDHLVYVDRPSARQPPTPWSLRIVALRRGEIVFDVEQPDVGTWRQDRSGNVIEAPDGMLLWQRLLRSEMGLGQVVAGSMGIAGDPLNHARLRGQVVAVGPQSIAGRRFDVAVIELFGDAQDGESFTRVEGAIAVDRHSGVLLRLDLRSANPSFQLQRRLARIEPGPG